MSVAFMGGQEEYDRLYAEASGPQGYATFVTQFGQTQQLSKTWYDEMTASSPLDTIANFSGPMLVLHGDQDTVVPASVADMVKAAYPEATLTTVPGADHGYGFYSDQPEVTELVDTSVADFFAANL